MLLTFNNVISALIMTSQQNSCYLKWKDYPNYLQKMMKEMLTLDNFTDVTLVTDDRNQIKAHRSILSAFSPVFKSIFDIKDVNNTPVVYLRGIQYSEIESILQFIYLGEAVFCGERLDEFLSVAKSLEMYELCIRPDNEYGKVNINSETIQEDALERRHHNIKDDISFVKNVALETLDSGVEIDYIQEQAISEEAEYDESEESQKLKIDDFDDVDGGVGVLELNSVVEHKSHCVQQQLASSETKEFQESPNVKAKRQEPERENKNVKDSNKACDANYLDSEDSVMAENDKERVENKQSNNHFQGLNKDTHKKKDGEYECPTCGKMLTTRRGFKKHLRAHTGELPYECNQCGKKFRDNGNMWKHVRSYHEGVIYPCKQCDYKARTESTLHGHTVRQHVDPKYVCDQCDFKSWHLSELTFHQLIHTDEKPFQCDTCGRKFRQKVQLKTHVRVHTGETPYKCHKCGKMFKFLATRDTHKCVVPQ